MNVISNETIFSLKQARHDLGLLQPGDSQSIIRIGATLEKVSSDVPEEFCSIRELVMLCLSGLQAIFEGKAADFAQNVSLMSAALIAVEHAVVSVSNPIVEAMIDHAKISLQSGLTDAEETQEVEKEDEAGNRSGAMEIEVISGLEDQANTTKTLCTLDEISLHLLQLEPGDEGGVKLLRESLKRLSGENEDPSAKKLLIKAARTADRILNEKDADEAETLSHIGDLVEQVMELGEENPPVNKPEPRIKNEVTEPVKDNPDSHDPLQHFEPDALAEDADKNLLSEFISESFENIEAAESALLALETDPENLENINTVFRAFHTIKGSAAFLGMKRLTELAHLAESLLSRMRDGKIRCTGGFANLALQSIDMLKEMLGALRSALEGGPILLPEAYGDMLRVLSDPEVAGVTGDTNGNVEIIPAKKEILTKKDYEKLYRSSRLGDILIGLKKVTTEQVAAVVAAKGSELLGVILVKEGLVTPDDIVEALCIQKIMRGEEKQSQTPSESSVRVRTDRLDRLIDIVGELVVAQSMLSQDETLATGIHFELSRKVAHAGKIVRELQELSMAMRMIPLKNTFSKLTRVVRDVAQKCDKSVEFLTDGEDTEIDRNMVDLIADPLVHMVRNSVDHGIESPNERQAAGKRPTGTVRISAYHSGGNVVVEIEDDGKGLDTEKILHKAIEKGLADSGKGLSKNEIFNLIFAPGMSTAEQLTDVSGRGVGMDVVRRNIESIQGRIEISSEKGKGSIFTIRLPLTLAVADGMLVRVGDERYIVPTVHIHLSFRPNANSISTIAGRGEMVHLRGESMPIVRLHSLFNIKGAVKEATEGQLMIISDEKRHCALLVDELLGQHQVVTKPLGNGVGKVQGLAGGAILGDGRVGLILDTAEIIALARQTGNASERADKNDSHANMVA